MSTNIALGKLAKSSSNVAPFSASRAVDGNLGPELRWLCSSVPCWMSVDLGKEIYINRWVLRHMGAAGWRTPQYVMTNFKLQGSLDNYSWFDIDIVTGNTSNNNDRTFTAANVRYVRVYVNSGLNINPKVASIVELQIFDAPPTSQYLSGLTLNNGTLTPAFAANTYNYISSVANSVSSITITPTAQDARATIKVNGTVVASGTASQPINLAVGSNTIEVEVTSLIGGLVQKYTVAVTRAASSLLSNLVPSVGTLNPAFNSNGTSYTVNVENNVDKIRFTPTAQDANATITVNGVAVASGNASQDISLNVGDNNIPVVVAAKDNSSTTTYNVKVVRDTGVYLSDLKVVYGSINIGIAPEFNSEMLVYSSDVPATYTAVKVVPTTTYANTIITVDGVQIQSGQPSASIALTKGVPRLVEIVIKTSDNSKSSTYKLTITRAN